MKPKNIILFLISLLIILSACHKTNKSTSEKKPYDTKNRVFAYKPNSGGNAGEVEVVIPKKLWDDKVGDTIFNILTQPFPGLPQIEPFYKPLQVDPQNFQNIYKEHRNIIIVKIGDKYKRGWLIQHDIWAANQLVITYQAPNEQQFIELFTKTSKRLLDTLYLADLHRYQAAYEDYLNKPLINELEKLYHISLVVPNTYTLDVKKKNFAWLSRETAKTGQEIIIYFTPYKSVHDFDLKNIIRRRDSVAKLNVPGPDKGTYMQTEPLYPPQYEKTYINGHFAVVVRGLWKTHGAFMGGPFVNISVLDQKRNRIITLDGFVYAGKQNKKLYLWQVEAILRSIKILD